MSNNYTKYYSKEMEKPAVESTTEAATKPVHESHVEKPTTKKEETENRTAVYPTGKVSGCRRLNIRKKPSESAEVIGTLTEGTEVTILGRSADGRFVRISTEDICDGYCMRDYIR